MTPEQFYRERLTERSEAKRLGWASTADQLTNFVTGIGMVEEKFLLAGTSIHDAGCGHGALLGPLRRKGVERYIGTDFMEEPLIVAREREQAQEPAGGTKRVTFKRLDLRTDELPKVDVTFVMGTLAFHKASDAKIILQRLFDASKLALVFNAWWDLDRRYVNYEEAAKIQRLVERFTEGKSHRRRIRDYGIPREAMFCLFKRH